MSWTQYCDWRDIETFLWGDPFRRARNNQDVDNILSKKFKPSSSHILEIYILKKGAGLLSAPPQVKTNRY